MFMMHGTARFAVAFGIQDGLDPSAMLLETMGCLVR
jgi:hypothetical protein